MAEEFRGSMYRNPGFKGAAMNAPEFIGMVTIDGVKVGLAVYGETLSSHGRLHRPILATYPQDEFERLARVDLPDEADLPVPPGSGGQV